MNTDKFTVSKAKQLHAALVKIANDQLDVAAAPASDAGSAGPQEVVDALEVVIDELEQVSQAIPAEPQGAVPEESGAPVEAPVEDAPVEPVPEEEEPKLAKQVQELTAKLAAQEKETLATQFASLFEGSVQQAKYDEVMSDSISNVQLQAKIETIEQYKTNEGASSSNYKPAKNMTSWVKRAKQVSNEGMMNL